MNALSVESRLKRDVDELTITTEEVREPKHPCDRSKKN